MSSTKAKSKQAKSADSTAPTPRCAITGRPLDQWGLPLNGPARVAALAELGLPDPVDEPEVWAKQLPVDTALLSSTLPTPPAEPEAPSEPDGPVKPAGTTQSDAEKPSGDKE